MTLPTPDGIRDPRTLIATLRAERDAAIAEKVSLTRALAARNAEPAAQNARQHSQIGERIAHQAATIDVLRAMSASPGDPQPVFELIVRRARVLCDADFAALTSYDGEKLRLMAQHGNDAHRADRYAGFFPRPANMGSAMGRAILKSGRVEIEDRENDPEYTMPAAGRSRSVLAQPLLQEGKSVGAILIGRNLPGPFTESQIALLETFAEQAVIAITSAETYHALQTRTLDLQASNRELDARNADNRELMARQAASIEVLKAIAESPYDPQPVFELIARRAGELCSASRASVTEFDGVLLHMRARDGYDSATALLGDRDWPRPAGPDTIHGRAVLQGKVVHVDDLDADDNYADNAREVMRRLGSRSMLGVPLLRDGQAIGAISLGRREGGGFDHGLVELVRSFADQAVIAIVSAQALRALQSQTADLQESLAYQTATSDVLKVISRSTYDLQPVLAMVAETAARLCVADQAVLIRHEGGALHLAANWGFPPEYEARVNEMGSIPVGADAGAQTVSHRAILERHVIHIPDVAAVPGYPDDPIRLGQQRTSLGVPLLREGEPVGVILLARRRVEPFTERQIELVKTFADQAVIAIENTGLLTEQREALERQTATAEVLQVINSSPGNLAPVFDALLQKALRCCDAAFGSLATYDGAYFHAVAMRGIAPGYAASLNRPLPPYPGGTGRLVAGENVVQIADITDTDDYRQGVEHVRASADQGGMRTALFVALRKDGTLLGRITIFRQEVRLFSDRQIALLENFAAQAVIAMENARLLNAQRELLERQTAMAEVLAVINASPGDTRPVFDAILEKALLFSGSAFGLLITVRDGAYHVAAHRNVPPAAIGLLKDGRKPEPGTLNYRIWSGEAVVSMDDIRDDDAYRNGVPSRRIFVDEAGARSQLLVALRKDDTLLGAINIYRTEVRPFTEAQIAMVQAFAAQAVIAMENARLLEEIRQRQQELRVTFENMGDGVALFDETPRLVAWNRRFQDILDVPDAVMEERRTYVDYIRYLTARGEFGPDADAEEQVSRLNAMRERRVVFERTRPNGRIIEVHHNPIPSGGFVLIYADITARKRAEAEIAAARDAAEEAARTIEAAYRDLKAAQANLIQAEKMASLGQLTAGIAHEIKNPLNFVNNFAELSVDLLGELKEAVAPAETALTPDQRDEVNDVVATLTSNLQKITEHGRRADGIVKSMLEHSRGASAERRAIDINALADEALNLAYHGARAQDQSFNITLEHDFADGIAPIEVNPQDITRVLLNLFSNGFYAANKRAQSDADSAFRPTLKLTTRAVGDAAEIRVRDNGTGIPEDIRDKLFQPFFTTKPTGEGTGLGLSLSYDIVVKQHGGRLTVESEVNAFTEFVVTLPRTMPTNIGDQP